MNNFHGQNYLEYIFLNLVVWIDPIEYMFPSSQPKLQMHIQVHDLDIYGELYY
jgi:hypothetical protein